MVKVGDWVVIAGLSEYKNYNEGEVVSIRGTLADVRIDGTGVTWNVSIRYLQKVRKGISRKELIDVALDLRDREWFMELTSND